MPVILRQDDEKRWLDKDIEQEEIKSMFNPYNQDEMEAYTISKLITRKGVNTNLPEVQKKWDYPELDSEHLSLF